MIEYRIPTQSEAKKSKPMDSSFMSTYLLYLKHRFQGLRNDALGDEPIVFSTEFGYQVTLHAGNLIEVRDVQTSHADRFFSLRTVKDGHTIVKFTSSTHSQDDEIVTTTWQYETDRKQRNDLKKTMLTYEYDINGRKKIAQEEHYHVVPRHDRPYDPKIACEIARMTSNIDNFLTPLFGR